MSPIIRPTSGTMRLAVARLTTASGRLGDSEAPWALYSAEPLIFVLPLSRSVVVLPSTTIIRRRSREWCWRECKFRTTEIRAGAKSGRERRKASAAGGGAAVSRLTFAGGSHNLPLRERNHVRAKGQTPLGTAASRHASPRLPN